MGQDLLGRPVAEAGGIPYAWPWSRVAGWHEAVLATGIRAVGNASEDEAVGSPFSAHLAVSRREYGRDGLHWGLLLSVCPSCRDRPGLYRDASDFTCENDLRSSARPRRPGVPRRACRR